MRDVSTFFLGNSVDTCAVWHVLSSKALARASFAAKCQFALTQFVLYECIHKPRSRQNSSGEELQKRLMAERDGGRFPLVSLSLEDVQELARMEERRRLGHGELSAIAFARRTSTAVLTDDRKAQKLAEEYLGLTKVQTTPHLLGWLVFCGGIVDSQVDDIIEEHGKLGGELGRHLRTMYEEALRCRLMAGPR